MAVYSSLADLVRANESGAGNPAGNYTAVNPKSGASGAFQFLDSTWRGYAASVPGASQYPTAADAPPNIQDAVFNHAVSVRGLGDWTCPGCNPAISAYVASNDVSGLPVFGSSNGSPAMSIDAPSDFTDPGTTLGNASGDFGGGSDNAVASDSSNPDAGSGTVVDPNTGIATLAAGPGNTGGGGVYNPAALENAGKAPAVKNSSAIPDVADAIKIGFGSIGDNIAASVSKAITSSEAYLQRFGVMILAIVLFIVAAWFMIPRETKDRIVQTAGTAAKAAA